MLPREYRLKHMKDWDLLFKEGRFVGGVYVTVNVWKIDEMKCIRRGYTDTDLKIGFALGKKVHKHAVQRNRVKRQMREVVRLYLKDSRIKSGYLVGIIAKPTIIGKDYALIEKDVHYVLLKAGLLTPNKRTLA